MEAHTEDIQVEVRDPDGASDLDGRYTVIEEREDGTLVLRRVFLSDEEFDAFVRSVPGE